MSSAEINFLSVRDSQLYFEPINSNNSIFCDPENGQVFCVEGNLVTGVSLKGPTHHFTFRLEDERKVSSIKFNHDCSVVGIKRLDNYVSFINFSYGQQNSLEYLQSCKTRGAIIDDFYWLTNSEVIFITDHGFEFFLLYAGNKLLRSVKVYLHAFSWSLWSRECSFLILASGPKENILNLFQFKSGKFFELPKFEVDLPAIPETLKLQKNDVCALHLYDKDYVCVVRQIQIFVGKAVTQLCIFLVETGAPPRKIFTLQIDTGFARVEISSIDNLFVAHDLNARVSYFYDFRLMCGNENATPPTFSVPFAIEKELTNFSIENCMFFLPNIITDAVFGRIFTLNIDIEQLHLIISDNSYLVNILINRSGNLHAICKLCLNAVKKRERMNDIFLKTCKILQQDYVCQELFNFELSDDPYLTLLVFDYLKSLIKFSIPASQGVLVMCFSLLNYTNKHDLMYYILSADLIIEDSKELACFLLSLSSDFRTYALDLVLKLLEKTGTANDEIVEILLNFGHILKAFKFVISRNMLSENLKNKFLRLAKQSDDKVLFFNVYTHLLYSKFDISDEYKEYFKALSPLEC